VLPLCSSLQLRSLPYPKAMGRHTNFPAIRSGLLHLQGNYNYKILPSAPAQHTCKLVERSFKSYLGLLKLAKEEGWENPINPPHFVPKKGHFMLIIPRNGFQVKGNELHIGISRELKKETGQKNLVLMFPEECQSRTAYQGTADTPAPEGTLLFIGGCV